MFKALFGRLLGSSGEGDAPSQAPAGEAVEHQGYSIIAQPPRNGGQFGTGGVIVKETEAGRKEHRFIRADTHATLDEARAFTIQKAQRLIDEQGERLFDA